MKALIWIGCIFTLSALLVILKNAGIVLGGVPTAILYAIMLWTAKTLTKKVDSKRENRSQEQDETIQPAIRKSENKCENEERGAKKTTKYHNKKIIEMTSYVISVVAIFSLIVALVHTTSSSTKTVNELKEDLAQTKKELTNTKTMLETTKNDLQEQKNSTENYKEQVEYLEEKFNSSAVNDDTSSYSFNAVDKLLNAIKMKPTEYNNVEVCVVGTMCKSESDNITALVDLEELPSASSGVVFRYAVRNNPNVTVKIADDIMYTVLETGDYIKICGVVKITNGEIYLDNCTYTIITPVDERD